MIYLDFAATTKPSKEAIDIFNEVSAKFWANPDSLHDLGIKAEAVLELSRKNVSECFSAGKDYDLIFTSSATESNDIILKNAVNLRKKFGKHILTSNIEHPSVREVMFLFQEEGFCVEFLPVNERGEVSVEQVRNAVKNDTILVSIMQVNNEIGSINDIFEIAEAVKAVNKNVLFHSDCSQSVGKLPINLQNSAVDFISFSGHKIECVRGVAAIIHKKNIAISPLFQYKNPAMTAALAKSLKIAEKNREENFEKVKKLQKILLEELLKINCGRIISAPTKLISINSSENNLPHIVNFSVLKHKSETILRALSAKEIYISTISACSAKKSNESYVIKAITGDEKRAKSSLRVSLSAEICENDILTFISELKNILKNI